MPIQCQITGAVARVGILISKADPYQTEEVIQISIWPETFALNAHQTYWKPCPEEGLIKMDMKDPRWVDGFNFEEI